MARGTPTTSEEPPVRDDRPADPEPASLDVELEPGDVWTLGQLVEADAASFPPALERELLKGYRILQAAGFDPAGAEVSNVDVAADVGDGSDAGGGDPRPLAREVVVAEVSAAEPRPAGAEASRRPAPEPRVAGAGDELERLAAGVEGLGERLEAALDRLGERADAEPRPTRVRGVLVDGALAATGTLAAAVLAAAAAVTGDPTFAALSVVVLVACGLLARPHLAGSAREGPP